MIRGSMLVSRLGMAMFCALRLLQRQYLRFVTSCFWCHFSHSFTSFAAKNHIHPKEFIPPNLWNRNNFIPLQRYLNLITLFNTKLRAQRCRQNNSAFGCYGRSICHVRILTNVIHFVNVLHYFTFCHCKVSTQFVLLALNRSMPCCELRRNLPSCRLRFFMTSNSWPSTLSRQSVVSNTYKSRSTVAPSTDFLYKSRFAISTPASCWASSIAFVLASTISSPLARNASNSSSESNTLPPGNL